MKRSNKSRLWLGDEGEPQIPWAQFTRVTKIHRNRDGVIGVDLETGNGTKASIGRSGDVSIEINSRDNISSHMEKSEELTESLMKYIGETEEPGFIADDAKAWLKGDPTARRAPAKSRMRRAFDWWPAKEDYLKPQKIGKLSRYRTGRPSEFTENWIGSNFKYVHFELEDGTDEGLVIAWDERHNPHSNLEKLDRRPEVWVGDVDGFFAANEEPVDDLVSFGSYNYAFENGFLWALDQMNVFEGSEIPEWAIKAIEADPSLLWPELVEKLLPRLRSLPEELEKAVLSWVGWRRAEAEEQTGQTRFWPEY